MITDWILSYKLDIIKATLNCGFKKNLFKHVTFIVFNFLQISKFPF